MKNKFFSLFVKFSFGGLISAAISFFSTPIITAIILPEEFGKASMFVLAFSFLLQLILMGSDQSFVRFFYQDKFKDNPSLLLSNAVIGPLVASFVSIIFIMILWKPISIFLIGEPSFNVAILLSIILVFAVIERFSTLMIRMSQKATLFSNLKIAQSLTNAVVVIMYAHFIEKSFMGIVYGSLVSIIIVAIIGVLFERKMWFRNVIFNKRDIGEVVKYGLPFIPTFIISWIFEGIDKMALRYYSNFNEIGLYTAASKIVAILTVLQITFSNFWVPIAYEAYENSSEKSKKLFENAYSGLSVIFFIGAILIITAKDIIIKLFAKDYLESADIMPFLVFMPIMYTLSEITVGGINFKKKTYWHLVISLLCTIINLIGVYLLVPRIGAKGAAISTGLAYIVFFYARTIISNYYFSLDFKLSVTSSSIVILLVVALINSFSKNDSLCYFIDFLGLVSILVLYKNQLAVLYDTYLIKKE